MKKAIVVFTLMVSFIFLAALNNPNNTSQPGLKAAMENGKKVYTSYCLSCHQADGSGVSGLNPPLIKTSWVLGDKKQLINIILKGMNVPIEIEDDRYENVMAPHAFLKDQDIADVLTYVRNSFGNKASVVTTAEVKVERSRMIRK